MAWGAQRENRPADVIWFVTDNRLTTARLGWRPTRSAETILRDIHNWLDAHPDLETALFGKPA